MKVTALIDEKIISDVQSLTNGKNITDSIVIALKDWIASKKLLALSNEIKKKPVQFKSNSHLKNLRKVSRTSRVRK